MLAVAFPETSGKGSNSWIFPSPAGPSRPAPVYDIGGKWNAVIGRRRGWRRGAGADLSCVFLDQADLDTTGWWDSKGADDS